MNLRGRRIYVGLSGGVDSAVSAALLKEAGAKVTGVFIKVWYPPGMPCTWSDDRRDAMRVAAKLHIPFVTLDARKEYKEGVIDYLLREYAAGRTPNPDVMCNREVKFGAFLKFAEASGADCIATGHYARLGVTKDDGARLLRGVSEDKDQSYFLWAVPKQALQKTVFPVGAFEKKKVRDLARKYALPVAAKKDSQGVCFLGSVSVDEFLTSELGSEEGRAIDEDGREIGKHKGAILYTLGERVGIRGEAGPWYVAAKRIRENELVVSKERIPPPDVHLPLSLLDTNWLREPNAGTVITAQSRYHGPNIKGVLERVGDGYVFVPSEKIPEYAAAGQSLVLYDGEELVGGGIIAG